jgi:hypothetical protein
MERTQPPALLVQVELEGTPRLMVACRFAGEEARLRFDVGARLELILAWIQAELEAFAGRAVGDLSPSAIAAAGKTIVRDEWTVRDVVARATAGEERARAWLAWAVRNLEEDDERLGAIRLFVSALVPDLWAELAIERGWAA